VFIAFKISDLECEVVAECKRLIWTTDFQKNICKRKTFLRVFIENFTKLRLLILPKYL